MTTGIYITQRELMALEGLSDLSFRIYFSIRSKMSMATQISGQHARNSLNALALFAEQQIPRGLGVQLVRPTRRQVGIAIDSLIRNRLLAQHGEPGTMIYRLPLAYSAAESQAQKAVRPAHTSRGDVSAQQAVSPVSTREFGNTSHHKTSKPVAYKAPSFIAYKSIASDSPTITPNAATAFSWIKAGHRIARPTGQHVPTLETLFFAGQNAVIQACQAAASVRHREHSIAPINVGLIKACLPKSKCSYPAPTQISPRTDKQSSPRSPRPATVTRQIDQAFVDKGMKILANYLSKKEARV